MSSSWHGATKCHQVFEAKWYMGFFGQLSCKRHIGYSNARSLLAAITAKGGYMTVAEREQMTKVALAEHKRSRSRFGQRTFTGVQKKLKQSQMPDCNYTVNKHFDPCAMTLLRDLGRRTPGLFSETPANPKYYSPSYPEPQNP